VKKVANHPTLVFAILYIKATWCLSVCLCGQKLGSAWKGSAWKILPVTARSLWSVLGGGARESPVKHGAGGPARAGRSSTGALCIGFTLQSVLIKGMDEMFVWLDDETNFGEAFFLLATVCPTG